MADTAAPAKGLGATLGKKIGPFPLGVWAAGGIGAIWYIRKQQASSASANPAAQQSQTGYGTDPAGNTGYIDPQTGYVYGSAEDISALQNRGAGRAEPVFGRRGHLRGRLDGGHLRDGHHRHPGHLRDHHGVRDRDGGHHPGHDHGAGHDHRGGGPGQ